MSRTSPEIATTWIAALGVNQELRSAISKGLSAARLILKGNIQNQKPSIKDFCVEARKLKSDFKVMVDLPGSKPRLGYLGTPRFVVHGQSLTLSYSSKYINNDLIPTECLSKYQSAIKVGHRILVNDGKTTLEVCEVSSDHIKVVIVDKNAIIMSGRSLNLPDSEVRFSAFTSLDEDSLRDLCDVGIDMVAVSMVNDSSDICRVRNVLETLDLPVELIAKIETPEALLHLDEIVENSDSLMIARGDLTTLCGGVNLFSAQEQIIKAGSVFNKDIICATGLLSSIGEVPNPSISEVCDASYLIQQGVSRFLLADADLALKYPTYACDWINALYSRYEHSSIER